MPGVYNRKDRLYEQAKADGYRSRAAYKLIELDRKYKLFKPGLRVLDLGAAPGGWVQVAAERVRGGLIVGVDLNAIEPINVKAKPGSEIHLVTGDMNSPDVQNEIRAMTRGQVDVLLSDMSPKLSGVRFRDACLSAELVQSAYELAKGLLARGGTFVAKIFPGPETDEIAKRIRADFRTFARPNLDASRKTSNECYFVAQQYSASHRSAVERSESLLSQ